MRDKACLPLTAALQACSPAAVWLFRRSLVLEGGENPRIFARLTMRLVLSNHKQLNPETVISTPRARALMGGARHQEVHSKMSVRPQPAEADPYYFTYIEQVPGNDVLGDH